MRTFPALVFLVTTVACGGKSSTGAQNGSAITCGEGTIEEDGACVPEENTDGGVTDGGVTDDGNTNPDDTGDSTADDTGEPWVDPDADGDGIPMAEDCDDANAELGAIIHDNDCDGSLNEADCDSENPAVYPGAPERCNGIDDDCDWFVDEDPVDEPTWYADNDGDGHGNPDATVESCAVPLGYTGVGDDPDDNDGCLPDGTARERTFRGTQIRDYYDSASVSMTSTWTMDSIASDTVIPGCPSCDVTATLLTTMRIDGGEEEASPDLSVGVDIEGEKLYFAEASWGDEWYIIGDYCTRSTKRVTGSSYEASCESLSEDGGGTIEYFEFGWTKGCDPEVPSGGSASEDADEDGWTEADGDCNDDDASIHPTARDHCNDGIDQDCDEVVDNPDCEGWETCYADCVLAFEPSAYWRLDESPGSMTALNQVDASTYPGTYTEIRPSLMRESGAIAGDTNTAVRLEGGRDAINFGDVFDLGTTTFSLSFWVKTTASTGYIIGKSGPTPGAGRWGIGLQPSGTGATNVFIDLDGEGGSDLIDSHMYTINDGEWHNITLIVDRDDSPDGWVTAFVDGEAAIVAWSALLGPPLVDFDTPHSLVIGRLHESTETDQFEGSVDDVSFFDHSLDISAIRLLYQLGFGG